MADTFEIYNLPVYTRSYWGARAPAKSRVWVGYEKYDYLEIHHGASGNLGAKNNPASVMRGYQNLHLSKNWSDLFYCVGLDKKGRLWDGRSGYRSHKGDWGNAFTVVLSGNNDIEDLTDAQRKTILDIWGGLSAVRGHTVRFSYHAERASTLNEGAISACPGKYAISFIKSARSGEPQDTVDESRDYLSRGSSGAAVENLQKTLNDVFEIEIIIDGDFGPITEEAVKRAQVVLGVTVDGMWGEESELALIAYKETITPVDPPVVTPPVHDNVQLSDEYLVYVAGRSVQSLYERWLGRPATTEDVKYWGTQLLGDKLRIVADLIANSPEGKLRREKELD